MQNLSSAAVVIGPLRVKIFLFLTLAAIFWAEQNHLGNFS